MFNAKNGSLLLNVRYSREIQACNRISQNAELKEMLDRAYRTRGAHAVRGHFLSDSVRVDPGLLPGLAQALQNVAERAWVTDPFEAFVFSAAEINAAVVPAQDRNLVILSSAAIERLEPSELDFVIGHELGHALYGHMSLPVAAVLESSESVGPRQAMQLMAWKRHAEISADRAGLMCCGSLEVAATALFKTLSGLSFAGLRCDPDQFAAQWNELAAEVRRGGSHDYWSATHPFPPLRMKALLMFWHSDLATQVIPGAPGGRALQEIDEEIDQLLAMMDPLAREDQAERKGGADPLLREFLFWGGLYIAAANQVIEASELDHLRSLVGDEMVDGVVAAPDQSPEVYRERFLAAKTNRVKPLSALELHRIFSGLATIAKADGSVDDDEISALQDLAKTCGINERFIDSIL
ncbi:MAG: M48 family metallopeptidase [bacterium]|nr:M48 family metallopeptidase [bacterium]